MTYTLPLLSLLGARAGDAEAGRALMEEFAYQLRNGIRPDVAELLAGMLEQIAEGEDANVAMLVKQRGAPKNSARDHWIWRRVKEVRHECATLSEAYRKVAAELQQWPDDAVSAKRVKSIFLDWESAFDVEANEARWRSLQERLAKAAKKAQ